MADFITSNFISTLHQLQHQIRSPDSANSSSSSGNSSSNDDSMSMSSNSTATTNTTIPATGNDRNTFESHLGTAGIIGLSVLGAAFVFWVAMIALCFHRKRKALESRKMLKEAKPMDEV